MASFYKRQEDPGHHRTRIQDPIQETPSNLVNPSSTTSTLQGSNGSHGQRSVRFAEQGSNRARRWARFYKSTVYDSQKDWRSSTSPQPATTESVRAGKALQNGDDSTCLSYNKPKGLSYIYRSARCFPTRSDPPLITSVPTVHLEGQTLPVQSPAIRSVTGTSCVHQGPQTSTEVGTEERHTDLGIPRRLDHSSQVQESISESNSLGSRQAEESGIPDQGIKVQPDPIKDSPAPGIRDRHHNDDTEDPRSKDPRRSQRSIETGSQGAVHSSTALVLYRQGHRHDRSRFPSPTQSPAPSGSQDSSTEIRISLGRLSLNHTGGNGGATVVAHSLATMERTLMDCVEPTSGHLHRLFQFGMGSRDQQSVLQGLVGLAPIISPYQLQGIVDSLSRSEATISEGTQSQHYLRQHNDNSVYQPLRRDKISRIDGTSDINMELVPGYGNQDSNDIRALSIQPSRCTIPATNRSTGVVLRSRVLPKARTVLGSSPRRSLRIADKPPIATVHDLEAHARRHRLRRLAARLEKTGQPIPLPTMEPDLTHPAESQTGESDGDHHHAQLAISSLVPNNQSDGDRQANPHPTPPSTASSRKRAGHSGEEPPLVFVRLEDKRQRLMSKGWDAETASIIIDNPAQQRKHRQYEPIQDRYISWATSRGVDPLVPQPAQLLNWLVSGISIGKWTPGTVLAYKAAIIHMYEDKSSFSDPDFVQFFQVLKHRDIKHLKNLDLDLTPVLAHIRSQGPNEGLDLLTLTQKLCWLLGICGFLRPSDIQCIDLSNGRFQLQEVSAILPILLPKETRGGSRICKYTTIKSVDDQLVCPLKALQEYIRRIEEHTTLVAHPKDSSIQYRPLIRDVRDLDKPIGSERISKHISSLSRLIHLPSGTKLPKARAIGSTAAMKKGAKVEDVVTHGNWSSSILFDQFYRLNAATASNFTALVLE
jgi:hypothetical protein